jgi:hypothetical protein
MSEKVFISEYKGFELWDCPMPEGWKVNPYPVEVTANGVHVNNFANTDEAMQVIDGMDADTVAYHMRRVAQRTPPAQRIASAGEGDDWHIITYTHSSGVDTYDIVEGYGDDANSICEAYTLEDANALIKMHRDNARLADELAAAKAELEGEKQWRFVAESNWHDSGNALAVILKERGVDGARIGDYEVYKDSSGSASAIHVDANGIRIPTAAQQPGDAK